MKLLRTLTTSLSLSVMMFIGTLTSNAYTTISDTFTIDFDASTSSSVPQTGNHDGKNEYSYEQLAGNGDEVGFKVNVTALSGDPEMQIVMFDPTGSNWYASGDLISLVEGENVVNWGPFGADILLRFMIKVDPDDSVTFDSFQVANSQFSDSGDSGSGDSGSGNTTVDYALVRV